MTRVIVVVVALSLLEIYLVSQAVAEPLSQEEASPVGGLSWALIVAIVGFIISAAVGVYSAHSARKTSRENATLASWPAMVSALQAEVTRLQGLHGDDADRYLHYRGELDQLATRVAALEANATH